MVCFEAKVASAWKATLTTGNRPESREMWFYHYKRPWIQLARRNNNSGKPSEAYSAFIPPCRYGGIGDVRALLVQFFVMVGAQVPQRRMYGPPRKLRSCLRVRSTKKHKSHRVVLRPEQHHRAAKIAVTSSWRWILATLSPLNSID